MSNHKYNTAKVTEYINPSKLIRINWRICLYRQNSCAVKVLVNSTCSIVLSETQLTVYWSVTWVSYYKIWNTCSLARWMCVPALIFSLSSQDVLFPGSLPIPFMLQTRLPLTTVYLQIIFTYLPTYLQIQLTKLTDWAKVLTSNSREIRFIWRCSSVTVLDS